MFTYNIFGNNKILIRRSPRTQVWQETHTKDSSFSSQQREDVHRLHENDPSMAQGNLDQDPIARICGCDTRGRVRGMGKGISKYAISRSAPYKRELQRELKSNATLHTEVKQLKERMRKMERIFASYGWEQMQFSSNNGSSSQVRQVSPHQETRSDQATTQTGSTLCKLLYLAKNACVAYGRPIDELAEELSWQRILLDEIVDGNVNLVNGRGKLGDLAPCDIVDWPEFRIVPF